MTEQPEFEIKTKDHKVEPITKTVRDTLKTELDEVNRRLDKLYDDKNRYILMLKEADEEIHNLNMYAIDIRTTRDILDNA